MAKKKESETAKQEKVEKSLEQLILDRSNGKYSLVGMAAAWGSELRRREEYRHLNQNEILELSLQDVLNGKVSTEQIEASLLAAEAQARAASGAGSDSKEKK